jgi:hypothetical protein
MRAINHSLKARASEEAMSGLFIGQVWSVDQLVEKSIPQPQNKTFDRSTL